MTRSSPFLPPVSSAAALSVWLRAAGIVAGLHLGVAGAVSARGFMQPASVEEFGAESVIEFAPVVTSAESDFAPEAADRDAEDKPATPHLDETLSKKREDDLPTEQASPAEAVEDLRMAAERTQKEKEDAPAEQQATEAMAQQEQSISSQASVAADSAPEQTGAIEQVTSKAPEEGNSAEAQRRIEAWQRQIFAHIVRFKRYPEEGRAKRLSGETLVAFSLDRDGGVDNLRVARSSGSALLDQAALGVLRRAAPLPKPPAALKGDALAFSLPMRFALR